MSANIPAIGTMVVHHSGDIGMVISHSNVHEIGNGLGIGDVVRFQYPIVQSGKILKGGGFKVHKSYPAAEWHQWEELK